MPAVIVACPHCGRELKLRDRSKLGRKSKCPACHKPFRLKERMEEEVELELATEEPAVGTAAKWVPDEPVLTNTASASDAGQAAASPTRAPAVPQIANDSDPPGIGIQVDDGGLKRLQEIKQRNAKRRKKAILLGGLTALAVFGAIWAASSYFNRGNQPEQIVQQTSRQVPLEPGKKDASTGGNAAPVGKTSSGVFVPTVTTAFDSDRVLIPHQSLTPTQLKDNLQLAEHFLPQREKPVRLLMIPSGMNVVIHLRPAQLWSDDPVWQELRFSLTEDVTTWIAEKLKEICRREPSEIEECLICLRLGATGTEPEIACVVHLKEEAKLSDLIEEFRGQPLNEQGGPRVNIAPPYAYLIRNTKTIAIAPDKDAEVLPQYLRYQNPDPTEGIYRMLDYTDRDRVFTILFELDDVKRHEDWLFSERTRPIFRRVLNWFGDDVETVGWSVDVQDDTVVSDLWLRTRSVASPARLAKEMLMRLEALPGELLWACQRMRPSTKGFRDIIKRFPAMMEAYRQATIPSLVDGRHVRLTTPLPLKAGPNLALGTLLTWDQSTQTDFSSSSTTPIASAQPQEPKLPDTVAGRLKMTLDADISMPFQNAVAYVAEETKLTFDIDGNALKDAGFTKNMPQKFNLGMVSANAVLKKLTEGNKPPIPEKAICFVLDEPNMRVLVTTRKFAEAAGQTIYEPPE